MVNIVSTGIVIIIYTLTVFYVGYKLGQDKQGAINQKVFDSYDKMINDRDLTIRNLKLKIESEEKKHGK